MATAAWSSADAYENYIGRWSRRLAPTFVEWVGLRAGARVVDVGCGTGALTEAALARQPASLVGVDLSSAYVDESRRRFANRPNARFDVADATDLPLPDASADAAVSGLVLNFVPDPARMVRELRRVLTPGGVAAAYVWDYAGKMEMVRAFWDAAAALDPKARELDAGAKFTVCHPERLHALFEDAGLTNVTTRALDVPTVFRDFDDYWTPFMGGQGPAGAYAVGLDAKAREALRERVRERLPVAKDGSIPMVARAWGVKGTR